MVVGLHILAGLLLFYAMIIVAASFTGEDKPMKTALIQRALGLIGAVGAMILVSL